MDLHPCTKWDVQSDFEALTPADHLTLLFNLIKF